MTPKKIEIKEKGKGAYIPAQWAVPDPPGSEYAIYSAAVLLLIAGLIAALLSVYGLSSQINVRLYHAFALVGALTYIVTGIVGIRNAKQFLNRNYVCGYIVLSLFGVLSAGGLILLSSLDANQPFRDVVGGAEAALSFITIILVLVGFFASKGCRFHPPDSRVYHFDDETV